MKRLFYWITLVLVSGCIYPYDAPLEQNTAKVLVVEGNLQTGALSKVTLSYLKPPNGNQTAFPTGTGYIEDSSGRRYEASGDGRNLVFDTREASPSLSYKLVVSDSGNTYESDWLKPLDPPQLNDVVFEADEDYVYVKLSMQAGSEGSGYAAAQIVETWKFHTDYLQQYKYDENNNVVVALMKPDERFYYCWRTMDSGENILIDYTELNGKVNGFTIKQFSRYDNRNHERYSILVNLRNLPPEEYRYRKVLDDNNAIGGDLFSPEPGEIPSNLRCVNKDGVQVLGYVNISQTVSRRYFLDSRYLKQRNPGGLVIPPPDEYKRYFVRGYEPVDYTVVDNTPGVGWGPRRCFNCVEAGGTLEEPDFLNETLNYTN